MDFITFRKFATPVIIQILFWIGVVACFAGGIAIMVASESGYDYYGGGGSSGIGIAAGLALMLLGPLFVRVWCELLIVIFRIYDELRGIRYGSTQQQMAGAPADIQAGWQPSTPSYPGQQPAPQGPAFAAQSPEEQAYQASPPQGPLSPESTGQPYGPMSQPPETPQAAAPATPPPRETPAQASLSCPYCGGEIRETSKFCPNCGKTIIS